MPLRTKTAKAHFMKYFGAGPGRVSKTPEETIGACKTAPQKSLDLDHAAGANGPGR
jgi:hypothetical protein